MTSEPKTQENEKLVLVLQGGGALGAYQAGVYEGLASHGLTPGWLSGISIGALNAAIIAGNPPGQRIEKLRDFWHKVSSSVLAEPLLPGDEARAIFNDTSAAYSAMFGLPGFFQPRLPPALMYPPGAPEALSLYDTAPLRQSLERLVDFDRINDGDIRLAVGAVNVRSGNFNYFDSAHQRIGPEHIMASGALPPGFPPIEIDGEVYWDGGLVSNTPLQYVLDDFPRSHMCIFQIDLFSAQGPGPQSLLDVTEREKDIRFSSRTRLNTDAFKRIQLMRRSIARLIDKIPDELSSDPDVELLRSYACKAEITIMHLIHRRKNYHSQSKDFEFSRHSILEHWQAGYDDLVTSVEHEDWLGRDVHPGGVAVFDLANR